MRRIAPWSAALILTGCAAAGSPITTSLAGNSAVPAPDAYTCAREQVKALGGWRQTSYDDEALRVTAVKYDDKARRPDVQFHRLVHRIFIDVDPGTGGAVTTIKGDASTFGEYATQRGPTEIQEKTSDEAKQAAQTIISKCSQAPAPVPATK
jgi:hypothetical protein